MDDLAGPESLSHRDLVLRAAGKPELLGSADPTFRGDAGRWNPEELLVAANRLAAKGRLVLLDAVVVLKDADGHTHVKETIDPTPGRTAFSGAVWAGLFGLLLGGPVGWLAGTAVGAGAGEPTIG